MWNVTSNILLAGMWKSYMKAYTEAMYGIKPVDKVKEKE